MEVVWLVAFTSRNFVPQVGPAKCVKGPPCELVILARLYATPYALPPLPHRLHLSVILPSDESPMPVVELQTNNPRKLQARGVRRDVQVCVHLIPTHPAFCCVLLSWKMFVSHATHLRATDSHAEQSLLTSLQTLSPARYQYGGA